MVITLLSQIPIYEEEESYERTSDNTVFNMFGSNELIYVSYSIVLHLMDVDFSMLIVVLH